MSKLTSHDVGQCDPDCYQCRKADKATQAYYDHLENMGLKEEELSFEDFEQQFLTSAVNNGIISREDALSSGWRPTDAE